MDILLTSLPFITSALLAGVMGFAIQRGATCTVAAVNEVIEKRRFRRLLAMLEASVWVTGGIYNPAPDDPSETYALETQGEPWGCSTAR